MQNTHQVKCKAWCIRHAALQQLTSIVVLACHILIADQVHAISEGSDQSHVCDRIQGAQLVEGQLSVQVMDGDMGQGAIVAIDAANDLMDHTSQFLQPVR